MNNVKVNYKNKEYIVEKGTTLLDFSNKVKDDYKYDILSGSINNRLCTLNSTITKDCKVDFYDVTSLLGNRTYERGLYFLLAKAVMDTLNCDVKIMHVIDKGVYCQILSNSLITDVIVEKIKLCMKDLIEKSIPIEKITVSRLDAIDYYGKLNQEDKAKSLRYISNASISLYRMDDTLDYFYGVLPINTNVFKSFDIKHVKDNKIILLFPYLYDLESSYKYVQNDKVIESIDRNDKYLERMKISTSVDLNEIVSTGQCSDIIRLSESLQNNRLFNIVEKIDKDKNIKLVLITGPSSSGKTTMSKKLTLFLKSKGYDPIPISVDDFYKELKDRPKDENGNYERERASAFDTNLFNNKVAELLEGKEVRLPSYNFEVNAREYNKPEIKMNENSILIVEGIHAFNDKLTEIIPDKNKFKIFISPETPLNLDNHNLFRTSDNRLLRRIVRDNRSRKTTPSDTFKTWKQVRKIEEEIILPYSNEADEIINTSLFYELSVLKTYAEPLLFSVKEDDEYYDEALRLINMFRVILGMPSEAVPEDSILREFIGGSCFD